MARIKRKKVAISPAVADGARRRVDPSDELIEAYKEQIHRAVASGRKLQIIGGNTKHWYGNTFDVQGDFDSVQTSHYTGVIEYEPTELFIHVKAGTILQEVQQLLDQHGQMFAFEPPHFGAKATIGGMVAAGLSGPRRAYAAAIKDHVLGVSLLNGRAELLRFGSKVIKNVAGYDVSRLMVGAMGSLGLLLDVTFKVIPKPQTELSLAYAMSESDALRHLNRWAGKAFPITASCYHAGRLTLRLSGAQDAVKAAQQQLGGVSIHDDLSFWTDVREQQHHFFSPEPDLVLWRLSLPYRTPSVPFRCKSLIEWGGAQRWLWTHENEQSVREFARLHGGHATMFRYASKGTQIFPSVGATVAKIEEGLRKAFDPSAVFDLGKKYRQETGVS